MRGAMVLFLKNTGTNRVVKALSETKLFGQDQELTFAVDRETRKPVPRIVDRQTNRE